MPLFSRLMPEQLRAVRELSPGERRMIADDDLRFRTNAALLVAILLGILAIAVHCVGHFTWLMYFSAVGAACAAFGAALGTGAVLGFLFGVPSAARTQTNINNGGTMAVATGNEAKNTGGALAAPPATPPVEGAEGNASVPMPVDNSTTTPTSTGDNATTTTTSGPVVTTPSVSNLEQVADWVTKLLLGGGLTQMQRIPPKIWSWAGIVALGIVGPEGNTMQVPAQQAFAAGLLVYGFILGFFAGFLITKLQLGKAISD